MRIDDLHDCCGRCVRTGGRNQKVPNSSVFSFIYNFCLRSMTLFHTQDSESSGPKPESTREVENGWETTENYEGM